ncbi:MAG: TolC family protein [Pyrinomonadaceae bacterium]|nr:TolC family protein [Pyrinomonadaceae bacterium]
MLYSLRRLARWRDAVCFCAVSFIGQAQAQMPPDIGALSRPDIAVNSTPPENTNAAATSAARRAVSPTVALYFNAIQGASSADLVRRALAANGELGAVRLEATRARARLRQAGLRPNPIIDFEHTTGRLTGSADESETSVGFGLPIELGGKRRRRIELAQAELEAVEAEISDRERRLANDVRALYVDALASLRELETTEGLTNIDLKTVVVVQARVSEGDTAPIELNQLRVEVDRLRSRRALVEGRLRSALIRLKNLTGTPPAEVLQLREDINAPGLPPPPASREAAIEIALRTRPDLRLARLNEEVAQAGLKLARAQGASDVTAFTRYTQSRSAFDDTPVGILRDKDKLLTFGVSVSIPVFNKNQGAKAEAAIAISQARARREFLEAVVRADVQSAYARYEAARAAVESFESGVIERSNENIRTIRAAYEIGAFRITDLLVEQRRLVDSQREFTEALAEQYRALSDLQSAIGTAVEPQQQ